MSDSPDTIPDFADLAADPEIAALLGFEPVPMRKKVNGWDADAQRAFIVLLAATGSKLHAAEAIGRKASGIDRILKRPDASSLSAAVDSAMALAERRNGRAIAQGVADTLVARALDLDANKLVAQDSHVGSNGTRSKSIFRCNNRSLTSTQGPTNVR